MKSLEHIFCFVIVVTICFSSNMYAQDSTAGSFEYDGHMRDYEVFYPHNFQANMPLVLNLHGHDEPNKWFKRYTLLHETADTSGFIVVYPRGINVSPNRPSWNIMSEDLDSQRSFPTTDDVGFISALIDTMYARYDIDLARVYCCGYGTGGDMTFRIAGECGQRFAAVAAVASTLSDDAYNWQWIRPLPVLHMNGTAEEYWNPYYEGRDCMWPISQVIDYWLNMNHCTFQPDTFFVPDIVVEDSPPGNHQCTVQKISFTDCDGESEFIHYKIIDGGCSWPGSTMDYLWKTSNFLNKEGNRNMDISANVEILNFFKKHQNPLVDIAYGKSTEIVTRSVRPDGDTLRIKAQIANPENHPATVFAIYKGENTSFQDSIQLYDDGQHHDGEASDNVWGGAKWISGIVEDLFEVRLRTRDLEEETIHDMQLSNLDYFTSIGPLKVDHYDITSPDTIPNLGDQLYYKLTLKNAGQTATAENVIANLISLDTCVTIQGISDGSFGDITAGETATHFGNYVINFGDTDGLCVDPMSVQILVKISSNGLVFWYDTLEIAVAVSNIEMDKSALPKSFVLEQNYPNPFNPVTMINYQLPITNYVNLSIYNLLGQKVTTLVNKRQQAGYHEVEFNGQNLSSGVYLYRIEAGEWRDVKKMILLR